jgi:hypothetical protein
MGIYEVTLYERPTFGDPRPVIFEGREITEEIVADTGSKARYKFWSSINEYWTKVKIQDIRVKSLSKREPRNQLENGWEDRLSQVNEIIKVIGSHGRRFLSENSDRRTPVENPFFAHFFVDKRNEIWYVDRYSRKSILVRHKDWTGFSDGGTLRDLVKMFANYIHGGCEINKRAFGPFPEWACGGDIWGYGKDEMQKVRDGIMNVLQKE